MTTTQREQFAPIYSFSALKTKQREVKDRSLSEVLHITENGNGAYIFCSEEVFEREKQRAAQQAVADFEIAMLIERGREDMAKGNYVEGMHEAFKKLEHVWNS